ncbi:hypothetical protein [Curvibacter lanceolatus]|uniref:hypothetical protein n=1 Tax=Curvibacter lanceolatus TaxID=86182 RepID=UPI0003693130|nr:hypothetical protein [Curvibacter lanceolatus]
MSAPDQTQSILKTLNIDELEKKSAELLASGQHDHFVESDIVQAFRESISCGIFDERLRMGAADTVVYEMPFKFGRADIVIFHIDGSATVIEVKDGAKGYKHVVSGIGQAGLYAAQLAMSQGAIKRVRKCLLWTSAGSCEVDGVIEITCEQASVIALPWQSTASLAATRKAIIQMILGEVR